MAKSACPLLPSVAAAVPLSEEKRIECFDLIVTVLTPIDRHGIKRVIRKIGIVYKIDVSHILERPARSRCTKDPCVRHNGCVASSSRHLPSTRHSEARQAFSERMPPSDLTARGLGMPSPRSLRGPGSLANRQRRRHDAGLSLPANTLVSPRACALTGASTAAFEGRDDTETHGKVSGRPNPL